MSNTKSKKTQPKKQYEETKKTNSTNNKNQSKTKNISNEIKNTKSETKVEKEKKISIIENEEKRVEEVKEKNSIVVKIINVLLWIILFIWMGICLYDFFQVKQEKKPIFCIKEETIQYEDGTVETCLGLGYRTYEYKRDSYKGYEFGPFWTKDRSNKELD